jgi:hypothetical protein
LLAHEFVKDTAVHVVGTMPPRAAIHSWIRVYVRPLVAVTDAVTWNLPKASAPVGTAGTVGEAATVP